jgi:hypothetical protein
LRLESEETRIIFFQVDQGSVAERDNIPVPQVLGTAYRVAVEKGGNLLREVLKHTAVRFDVKTELLARAALVQDVDLGVLSPSHEDGFLRLRQCDDRVHRREIERRIAAVLLVRF